MAPSAPARTPVVEGRAPKDITIRCKCGRPAAAAYADRKERRCCSACGKKEKHSGACTARDRRTIRTLRTPAKKAAA